MREDVHACRVPPNKEGLVLFFSALHEVKCLDHHLIVNRFHALACQRTCILDRTAGKAMYHATRTEFLFELRIFRVVWILRFFFRIQVIQVAEKLIKTMCSRQHFVTITEVILAKLSSLVTTRL